MVKPKRTGWKTWPPIVILKYWLHQSNRYMNPVELLHRWFLEALVFIPFYILFSKSLPMLDSIGWSFLISHSFSATFNGHPFALIAHDLYWLQLYGTRPVFFNYIESMQKRIENQKPEFLSGAVFFGSLSRGHFKKTSDLDVRFIPKPGLWNALRCAHLVFQERIHAFFKGFPLDSYMFLNEAEIRKKMDVSAERPVALILYGDNASQMLPELRSFQEFKTLFMKEHEA